MKKKCASTKSLLLFLCLLALSAAKFDSAKAALTFCNRSAVPLDAAVGFMANGGWYSKGWWSLDPGACAVVVGDPLSNRYYYAYAEGLNGNLVWAGDSAPFCIPQTAFEAPQGSCAEPTAGFQTVDTGTGNDYEYDFSCPGCLPVVKWDANSGTVSAYSVATSKLGGVSVSIPLEGHFSFGRDGTRLIAHMTLFADLGPLQNTIGQIVSSAIDRSEECGDHISTYGASLQPSGDGAALSLHARYQKWYCTYATVPQFRCQDTWIRVGPLKTKGVPKCTTYFATTRTSKNMVLQQSGSTTIQLLVGAAGGTSVYVQPSVVEVSLDGAGQVLADLFRVNLRAALQQQLYKAIGGPSIGYTVPSELQQFARVKSVVFQNDSGHLWLRGDGIFGVDLAGVSQVCSHLAGWAGCT